MFISYLAMVSTFNEKLEFVKLYERYRKLMHYAAKQILEDDRLAEEAVQEAFLRIAKNFDKVRYAARPAEKKFVLIITENAAKTLHKAVLLMALAGCAYAVTQVVINWNEKQNNVNGTLDVYFDVDDPDGALIDKGLRKPDTPEGYEIVSEEKDNEDTYYIVEYRREKSGITYLQQSDVDNIGLSIDNDDPGFKETTVNGYKGYCSYDEYGCFIIWCDGVYLYSVSGNCSMDILEDMAESIK